MTTGRPPQLPGSASTPRQMLSVIVGCAGVFGTIVLSARSGGGFFPAEYLAMGIAALVLASIVLVASPIERRPSGRAVVAVLALAAYGGWIGLSGLWSPVPATAAAGFQRSVAYVAVLVLGIATARTGPGARGLVVVVWGALAAIVIAGVASRLLPGLGLGPPIDAQFAGYRLSWPISYWNAQGTVAAMAVLLAVGIAADRRSGAVVRAAAAATVPIGVLCMLLTVSRGSILSLAVGFVALVALSRRPLQTVAVASCCAVPAAVAVLLATAQPAIVDDPTASPALSSAGPRLFVEVLALGAIAAGLSIVVFAMVRRLERRGPTPSQRSRPTMSRGRRHAPSPPWVPTAIVGVGVALLVGLGLLAGRLDGAVGGQTGDLRSYIVDQRRSFLDPQAQTADGLARLGTAGGSRSDLYRVAIDQFEGAPVRGAGSGAFPIRWLRERTTPQPVQNAHSLPLEALSETGLIGFTLLAAVIGAILWGAVISRRRPSLLPRSRAAGASAAVVAFLVSCTIDWTWQMGTLAAAALVLAAPLLTTGARGSGASRSSQSPGRSPIAGRDDDVPEPLSTASPDRRSVGVRGWGRGRRGRFRPS